MESERASDEAPGTPGAAVGERRDERVAGSCLIGAATVVFAVEIALWFQFRLGGNQVFEAIRAAYDANTLYLPPALLALGAAALLALARGKSRSRRLRGGAAATLACGFGLIGVRIWATHIEPFRLGLRVETFTTPKLVEPLTILHLSDIQSFEVGSYEEKAFARMRDLHPDLVIHTGDLLQPLPPATVESELPKMTRLLASLDAPLGKFTVVGDVDHAIYGELKKGFGGLRLLEGEEAIVDLPRRGRLRIFGLPLGVSHVSTGSIRRGIDRDGLALRKTIQDWLARGEPDDFTILIGHAPDFALLAEEYPIDLCLAGHTHGGQICIPGFGPLMTLSRVPRDWARGWREIGQTRLDVSAGIGAEHIAGLPSIRMFCPPEMVLIKALPAGEGAAVPLASGGGL